MRKKFLLLLICVFCLSANADEESQFSEEKDNANRKVVKKEKPEAVLPLEALDGGSQRRPRPQQQLRQRRAAEEVASCRRAS